MIITDLGLAKELDGPSTSSSTIYGMAAFVEPQCFDKRNYKRNEKSDIYSLGHLLWEITSGHTPFESDTQSMIIHKILRGDRESPIKGTPSAYIELYQQCWDNDP